MSRNLHELFAESLQVDEQAEADGWAAIYALGFACFAAGALFAAAVALVWSRYL